MYVLMEHRSPERRPARSVHSVERHRQPLLRQGPCRRAQLPPILPSSGGSLSLLNHSADEQFGDKQNGTMATDNEQNEEANNRGKTAEEHHQPRISNRIKQLVIQKKLSSSGPSRLRHVQPPPNIRDQNGPAVSSSKFYESSNGCGRIDQQQQLRLAGNHLNTPAVKGEEEKENTARKRISSNSTPLADDAEHNAQRVAIGDDAKPSSTK
ncbi:hypothetical protein niasHS_000704 [Heterodera schachtii]|uniref:Uncharacterized protein n=1 Tax=Heterodera schachtii TaxID=97005 RepID=A0ABD2KB65_HETSC